MQKYEYLIQTSKSYYLNQKFEVVEKLLNECAANGWKAVHFFKENTDGTMTVCFERPTNEFTDYNNSIIELLKK